MMRASVGVLVLVFVAVASAHAEGLGAGQPIMDMVVSVLRQLMVVAVDFIRLVLAELVGAAQSLISGLWASK